MSALTDLFTSLANKIRSKLGTTSKYTPAQAISAIDDVYNKGVNDTKVGSAVAADVRSDKTFTNSSSVGINGSMPVNPDTVNPTAIGVDANSPFVYFPYGYHPIHQGGSNALLRIPQAQANSLARPIHTGGTAWVTMSGINATAPFVYIPYGWYPQENTTYGTYVYMSTAQAQAVHAHTGTYTFAANDTGGTKDLGTTHGYRYVNASNVYNKGTADARAQICSPGQIIYGELGQGTALKAKASNTASISTDNEIIVVASVVGKSTLKITCNGKCTFDIWGITTSTAVPLIAGEFMSAAGTKTYTVTNYYYIIINGVKIGSTVTFTITIS